jgi:hypothetical protein
VPSQSKKATFMAIDFFIPSKKPEIYFFRNSCGL